MEEPTHDTSKLAAYLSGYNASALDREDDPSADADGHVISGTVVHKPDTESPMAPVRVRIGHGVAPATAASMLRKMADMVEAAPDFLSDRPGAAVRRLPDGTAVKKQLTIEGMKQIADTLPEDERARFYRMLDQIRVQIDDHAKDDPDGPDNDPYYRGYNK